MFKYKPWLLISLYCITLHAQPLEKVGKSEGQVDIIAWAGYIERGENDPRYDWVTTFEKNTQCRVNVTIAGTSDEMVALMNEGNFDLVTASGDAALRLVATKQVQEININLIPSWNTIDPRLQSAPWHVVNNKHYGVPYQWGANVLMYNTEFFTSPPESWKVVFEEITLADGSSNKNRVQAFDSAIYIADAALYLMHNQPALNIKNPYELNEEQYQVVLNLLRQQRKIIHRYWHDAYTQVNDFKNKDAIVSSSWGFQVNLLKSQQQPINYVIPKEGATGWADSTMLHVDAKHPNCAYLWMEHSLNIKLQGDLAAWFSSVPVVKAACENNPLLGEKGCEKNGIDNFDKIYFWRTPVSKCATQNRCIPYYRWVTDYVAILGGR